MAIRFKWVKDDRADRIVYERSFGGREKKRSKKDFVMNWESSLGWKKNPLTPEMMYPVDDFIAGREDVTKNINLFFIQSNRFGMVRGEEGSGKSTILIWLKEVLSRQKEFTGSFLPAKELKYDDFLHSLVKPFATFGQKKGITSSEAFSMIKNKAPRNKKIVFIVDDADHLSDEHLYLLKNVFSTLKNVCMVFSATDENFKPEGFSDDELGIRLGPLSHEGLREMLVNRIESVGGIDIDPFNDVVLKNLAKKVDSNPKRFLALCNKRAVELALNRQNDFTDEVLDENELDVIEKDMKEKKRRKRSDDPAMHSYTNEVDMDEYQSGEALFEGDKIVQEILSSSEKENGKPSSSKRSSKTSKEGSKRSSKKSRSKK